MNDPIDSSQRTAARVLGFCYLFAMAAGMFGESYVRGSLMTGDAVQTAQNILGNRGLFRLGIVVEMMTFISDTTVIAASYVILAPIHRHLALYATFLRLVAVAVSVMMASHSFDVLRILSGAEYLTVFEADQLAALTRLSLGTHGAAYLVAFVFLGLGSAVFAYLWIRSSYVPRALAVLGVIGSIGLSVGSLAILVVPRWWPIDPWYGAPMFIFEVGMGVLLLVRGLHAPPTTLARAPSRSCAPIAPRQADREVEPRRSHVTFGGAGIADR